MNLSMKWLNEFVQVDQAPRAFSEAMTLSGSKVEGYEIEGAEISNVVVGKILSITPHQDSDHLVICMVDVGQSAPIQIVTGANNLTIGDLVPAALHNATLPSGVKIKKGKLRGVESNGMLCSLGELGLTVNDFPYAVTDGIFVLQENCQPGESICSAIGLNDTKVEFEITSNRPDCFSVIGLAREVAATFDQPLQLHTPVVKTNGESCSDILDIQIEAPQLCHAYCAAIVKNVQVKPSPRWMRERLRAMGVRPINNIVDITNYVMLEYGQPMHAFDLRLIEDGKIRVRCAKNGETITTLDGTERTLTTDNLVIADGKKPVAIAGVMGGEYSGIHDDTTTIVFESACFDATSVRTTARDHGMRTDASSRYEKGLDANNCIPALNRACELVELLNAGEVLSGTLQDIRFLPQQHQIPLEVAWINRFLDISLSKSEMQTILEKLGCEFDGDTILTPTFRPDLEHKADIAEEIARFYGYNRIPGTALRGNAQGKYSLQQKFEQKISSTMLALGLSEIMTYSFFSPKAYDKILLPQQDIQRNSVTISNPLGEDTSIMRTTALPSMLEALARNYNNRNSSVMLFELASEYRPVKGAELPEEKTKLIAGMYGDNCDFFTAKGIVEQLLKTLNVKRYEFLAETVNPSYHPGRCAQITSNGTLLGILGEIHPTVAETFGINSRVLCFSFDINALYANADHHVTYISLPKFPAVTRDLALLCQQDIPVRTLEKAIETGAGSLLEQIELFDVYQGEQIEAGKKSVAFSLVLRSQDCTLDETKVNSTMKKIMRELEKTGAVLRL